MRMEITKLQLHCVLVCHFTVSFSASELCYKCFFYNDLFFMTLGLRFLWYICIGMEITFQLRFVITFVIVMYFLLRHNYVIYLFDVLMFFMRLELRYILVRSNYVRKLRYKMVIFQLRLFVTKK